MERTLASVAGSSHDGQGSLYGYSQTEARERQQVTTHDSAYAHGYGAGYLRAKIEDRCDFARLVLASQLDALLDMLQSSDTQITLGEHVHGSYSVKFVPMVVEFD